MSECIIFLRLLECTGTKRRFIIFWLPAFDNVDVEALHLARHAGDLQEELLHHDDDQGL
jgi:hypothetical protein